MATKQIYGITRDRAAINELRRLVTDLITPAFNKRDESDRWYYALTGYDTAFVPCIRITDRMADTQTAEFCGTAAAFEAIVPMPAAYEIRDTI